MGGYYMIKFFGQVDMVVFDKKRHLSEHEMNMAMSTTVPFKKLCGRRITISWPVDDYIHAPLVEEKYRILEIDVDESDPDDVYAIATVVAESDIQ